MTTTTTRRASVVAATIAWISRLFTRDLRPLFARLPLPMLALAASYGVYRFAALFVPAWVAVVQAAAFELTYIGLASQRDMSDDARTRATYISIGAVVVSIIYNSLAGLFERNPGWLADLHPGYEWALALLHGAPLALVAYLVADLLLHSDGTNLTAVVAQLRADLAQALADLTASRATIAQMTTDHAQGATTSAQQLAQLAQAQAATAQDRAADAQKIATLENQLRTERAATTKTIEQLRSSAQPKTPTYTSLMEYVRSQLAAQRSSRDIAAEIGVAESTLRSWTKKD